jgi:hypothetical protein
MGTSGTDKFHEYRDPDRGTSQTKDAPTKKAPAAGGPRGSKPGGPPKGRNKCEEPITNVPLEEVASSPYFTTKNGVPPVGTTVSVRETLVQGRVAIASDGDEVIGYLPVEYNYVRRCIEQGFSYTGEVVLSASRPIPTVRVTLSAQG